MLEIPIFIVNPIDQPPGYDDAIDISCHISFLGQAACARSRDRNKKQRNPVKYQQSSQPDQTSPPGGVEEDEGGKKTCDPYSSQYTDITNLSPVKMKGIVFIDNTQKT